MKLRIRKLLAAALVICLVVAMVPGAALASGAPNPFSIGSQTFATLQAAIDYTANYNNDPITLSSSYRLTDKVTLNSDKLIISSGATLTIATGAELTVSSGGSLELNGSIVVEAGETPNGNGVLDVDVSNDFTGSGSLTVNGTAELPAIALDADMTVNGSVTASGAVTTNGTVTVSRNGSFTLTTGTLTVANTLMNNGTVSAGTVFVNSAATLTNSGTLTATNVSVNGSITYAGTGTINNSVAIRRTGSMSVTGDLSLGSSASIALSGKLEVSGELDISTATSGLTLNGNDAAVEVGGELTVGDSYDFAGAHTFTRGAILNIGVTQFLGPNSYNIVTGSVSITKENSSQVLTIPSGSSVTISKAYDIGTMEVVLAGTLTVDNTISLNKDIEFDGGTMNIESGNSFSVPRSDSSITGDGTIYASGWFYFEPTSGGIDDVKITLTSTGGAYSNSIGLDGSVTNGESSDRVAPNNKEYSYSRVFSSGTYTITTGTITGGTVSGLETSAANGQVVEFTGVPSQSGYVVDRAWFILERSDEEHPISVNGNQCSFTMLGGNVTVYVTFKEAENNSSVTQGNITVTTNHNGNGSVNASINGRRVTVTARANTNYVIKSVSIANQAMSVSGTPQNGTWYYDVPGTGNATVSVYVTFEASARTVTVTNSSSRDGSVYIGTSGYTTTGQYKEGDRVYLRVVPDSSSFELRKLVIRNASNNTEIAYYPYSTYDDVYYFTMPDANVTVYGDFSDGLFEITTDIDGRGTLTIRGEDGETTDIAEEGEEVRIYASPSTGYRLGDIYVTYTDADKDIQTIYPEAEYNSRGVLQYYWFDMPEYDVEVYADFGEGDYVAYIDRSELKYGSVRVSPNVADEDDLVSVYITAETGYQLDKLVVEDEDGRSVSTNTIANGVRYTFNMPDSDVTVTATFKSKSYSSNFIDVARGSWYYDAVSYVASEGLMTGTGTNTFSPDGMTSRAQIVTILWRLSGEPSALTGAFTDVPAGQYYSTAVAWASREGIVTGVGNNRFEPNTNITREQLAVMLYRYAQDCGYSTTSRANITGYYDYARVGSYARDALSWAVGAGLITGTTTTTLSPQNTANRAQVATILMRFCENVVE